MAINLTSPKHFTVPHADGSRRRILRLERQGSKVTATHGPHASDPKRTSFPVGPTWPDRVVVALAKAFLDQA